MKKKLFFTFIYFTSLLYGRCIWNNKTKNNLLLLHVYSCYTDRVLDSPLWHHMHYHYNVMWSFSLKNFLIHDQKFPHTWSIDASFGVYRPSAIWYAKKTCCEDAHVLFSIMSSDRMIYLAHIFIFALSLE
jgi:hypothetical protein